MLAHGCVFSSGQAVATVGGTVWYVQWRSRKSVDGGSGYSSKITDQNDQHYSTSNQRTAADTTTQPENSGSDTILVYYYRCWLALFRGSRVVLAGDPMWSVISARSTPSSGQLLRLHVNAACGCEAGIREERVLVRRCPIPPGHACRDRRAYAVGDGWGAVRSGQPQLGYSPVAFWQRPQAHNCRLGSHGRLQVKVCKGSDAEMLR
jgi:hypothetical protein